MEYAGPVLETSESQDMNALNEKMQVAMLCWNHSIAGELVGPRFSDKEIIDKIGKVLKLSKQEASEFFKKMIERKSYLFPEELQQKGVSVMVMRKEISHLIAPFDLRWINFLEKPIPPNQKDKKFINNLNKLDSFIMRRAEYRRVPRICSLRSWRVVQRYSTNGLSLKAWKSPVKNSLGFQRPIATSSMDIFTKTPLS